jgi:hypothetical protein
VEHVLDTNIAPGGTALAYTSTCRTTQIFAYPILVGKLPAVPDANTLTTAVYLVASVGAPARTLTIATWDSGTPAGAGVVHALTRTALELILRFRVGKGTYGWRVIVDCLR